MSTAHQHDPDLGEPVYPAGTVCPDGRVREYDVYPDAADLLWPAPTPERAGVALGPPAPRRTLRQRVEALESGAGHLAERLADTEQAIAEVILGGEVR
jgi:hypothetical protein